MGECDRLNIATAISFSCIMPIIKNKKWVKFKSTHNLQIQRVIGMIEKRKEKRWHTLHYLKVYNGKTNKPAGRLVNISTEGIMLMSEKPIKTDTTYHLRIVMPKGDNNRTSIAFEAISRWSMKGLNPEYYDSGFQLKNVARDDVEKIECLIKESTFNY